MRELLANSLSLDVTSRLVKQAPGVFRATTVTVALIAALALLGCSSTPTAANVKTTVANPPAALIPLTVYKLPGCKCCSQYMAYLENAGFQVEGSYIMYAIL